MLENLEIKGVWWTRENPQMTFAGTLRYSPTDGATLEVTQISDDLQLLAEPPESTTVIHGADPSGKRITLHECFIRKRSTGLSGISISEYYVRIIIIGYHFNDFASIPLSELSADISYLKDWSGVSGFSGQLVNKTTGSETRFDGFNISYRRPDPISFTASEETEITIGSKINFSLDFYRDPHFKENVIVSFCPKTKIAFEPLYNKVVQFSDFVMLGLNRKCTIQRIYAIPSDIIDNGKKVYLDIYFHQAIEPTPEEAKIIHDTFFRYTNIKEKIGLVYKKWEDEYKKAEAAFRIYFGTYQRTGLYLDHKFMNYINALESFHRTNIGGSYEERNHYLDGTYRNLVSSIPESLDSDYKQSLKQKMKYMNEYSLRRRIKDLLSGFQAILDHTEYNETAFIEKVVNTRNYFTHLDPDLKMLSADGIALFELTEILEALFKCHLLQILSFSKEDICELIQSTKHYRRKTIHA